MIYEMYLQSKKDSIILHTARRTYTYKQCKKGKKIFINYFFHVKT